MQSKTFAEEIQQVRDNAVLLGSLAEDAVMKSVRALQDNDMDASRQILQADHLINVKRFEIEITIIAPMTTQQPSVRDLRMLVACLDICAELERIGDYAKSIAFINLRSGGLGMPMVLQDLFSMAEKSVDMLHRAITAFINEDVNSAWSIISEDDKIDSIYDHMYVQAIHGVANDARSIEHANYVIWVAHNLESLADRATNICERVIFAHTGQRPEKAAVAQSAGSPV